MMEDGKSHADQALRDRLGEEERNLAQLEEHSRHARDRIRSLREELGLGGAALGQTQIGTAAFGAKSPQTSAEKLGLFQRRFRGRLDVFARRWTNTRSGRGGYAPACANEWVRGVCEKPRVKCGECPNQAFLALTEQMLRGHLLGRHVVGVYHSKGP